MWMSVILNSFFNLKVFSVPRLTLMASRIFLSGIFVFKIFEQSEQLDRNQHLTQCKQHRLSTQQYQRWCKVLRLVCHVFLTTLPIDLALENQWQLKVFQFDLCRNNHRQVPTTFQLYPCRLLLSLKFFFGDHKHLLSNIQDPRTFPSFLDCSPYL